MLQLIINLLVPGVGTLMMGGKAIQGILQLVIWTIGFMFSILAIGAIIGMPMMFVGWVWALINSINFLNTKNRIAERVERGGPSSGIGR